MDKVEVTERYDLPEDVVFCSRCVMSNQRPRIVFDENGVCFACKFSDYKHDGVDWKEREGELQELLDRHRSKDGSFDIIVPSSGGKDSDVVAHSLKYDYGMHPLTVTWAPHIYTDIGWQNYQAMIHSGLDNIMGTPNGIVHRKLTRLSLVEMGDPFQPFIYGQYLFPLRTAMKFGIKLVFGGENGEAEYSGNPEYWDRRALTLEDYNAFWFSNISVDTWLDKGFTRDDLAMYLPPPPDEVAAAGIDRPFWSYYKKWTPQENFYYASENVGFQPNPDGRSEGTYSKYASLDDKLDGFHYYFMLLKFGIGRATSDAAHEVRDGHISREEAVALVHRYDTEFPSKNFEDFLEYCRFTDDEFWEVAERWRNNNLWEKVGNDWRLKKQVA